MDTRRIILYSILFYLSYTIWNTWQLDYGPKVSQVQSQTAQSSASGEILPPVAGVNQNNPSPAPINTVQNEPSSSFIQVTTDVLKLTIDLKQGDIVGTSLLDYPQSLENKNQPFVLLQNNTNEKYIASSRLIVVDNNTVVPLNISYSTTYQDYHLTQNDKNLIVTLEGKTDQGLDIKKIFTLNRGDYSVNVDYEIANHSSTPWKGYFNTQLLRSSPPEDKSSIFHIGSFTGASYSEPGQTRYKKVAFGDMNKSNLDIDTKGGWVAMQQHYFLSAWIPSADSSNKFYTRVANNDYIIGTVSQPLEIQPGQEQKIGAKLYIGPEITNVLKTIAPGLDLTVDYGFLWFLSSLLFSFMRAIYGVVGNWGWSIILVTVLIKLAFYRLSATSYKSMAGMKKLQPKLQALKERYGDNKAELTKATMELYKQEKINPLGGCLPILIQIPVFIALYWVLLESVELRQAPFIGWIHDLASADPYHILPIIMGATMLIQQKLNPAPADPMQAKMMMLLPILFTGLFWNFPAGLVLYWIVNNTLSVLQQWYITRKYSESNGKPNKKLVPAK